MSPGDTAFHYDKTEAAMVARSVVSKPAREGEIVWAARGSYAREKGTKPYLRAGWLVELMDYQLLETPLRLEQIRNQSDAVQSIVTGLRSKHGRPLYFPFAISDTRPLRPLQGYAFKLPGEFVSVFRELETGADLDLQRVATENAAASIEVSSTTGGQGFASSQEHRDTVERHSMEVATRFFEKAGFSVTDVSSNHPYDLIARRLDETVFVEVKGTSTDGRKVILTRNEVAHARRDGIVTVLFILHGIRIVRDSAGELRAVGGEESVLWPWDIGQQGELRPIAYHYTLSD